MEGKEIIDALQWRYATKQYDTSKKLEEDKLHTILEAGRLAASSAGTQPWKFVVISNAELKAKLSPLAYSQPQIEQSSHLVVLCAITNYDEAYIDSHILHTAQTKWIGISALEWYKNLLMNYIPTQDHRLKHQIFIALGSMLLAAAELKVDASPMGGFDPAGFDELLWLKEKGLTSVVLLGLGYRSSEDRAATQEKIRWPEDKVIIRLD